MRPQPPGKNLQVASCAFYSHERSRKLPTGFTCKKTERIAAYVYETSYLPHEIL